MYEIIIDRRGLAAGLTFGDLLDDSYLAMPGQGTVVELPQGRGRISEETEAASLSRPRPMLRPVQS